MPRQPDTIHVPQSALRRRPDWAALRASPEIYEQSVAELCAAHANTRAGTYARAAAVAEWLRRMRRRVELMTP